MKPEPTKTRMGLPICDHPGCGKGAHYSFDIKGAVMDTPACRRTCIAHRQWGQDYWEKING